MTDCACVVESAAPCCASGSCGGGCCDGGPPLFDSGAIVVPGAVPTMPTMPTMPPAVGGGLPLAPAPRLVPQPTQSQPVPYNP